MGSYSTFPRTLPLLLLIFSKKFIKKKLIIVNKLCWENRESSSYFCRANKSKMDFEMNNETDYTYKTKTIPKIVTYWLILGLVLIFFQVIIGGITRLTGSGLSITKWDIVTGTIPPISEASWNEEFLKYQQTPQYQKINQGMSMGDFKFIFFWEYFHRLWARSLGFIFLIPFLIFYRKKYFTNWLIKRLGILVLLGMVVALFGWIMVASGLVDRPWVNAYKLSLHLSLAIIVYVYLLWTVLMVVQPKVDGLKKSWIRKGAITILIIAAIQIFLGGMMSGMKAGLAFPTFPDMKGSYFPALLFDLSNWHWANFEEYDKNPFMATFVQFFHRNVAYILSIVIIWFYVKIRKETISNIFRKYATWMFLMLLIQVGLGIITIMNCLGKVPVMWGSFHQGGAILLFTTIVMVLYQTKER